MLTATRTFSTIEVWIPAADGSALTCQSADYGDTSLPETGTLPAAASLPGAVLRAGTPIVFGPEEMSEVERGDDLLAAGVTAAWGLPIFIGDQIASVVLVTCRPPAEAAGAIEVWTPDRPRRELTFGSAAYFGLERLGRVSRHICWPYGSGLPGKAWKQGMPQMVHGLDRSPGFVRGADAEGAGLSLGLALPTITGPYLDHTRAVCLLLSSRETPLLRAVGLWLPSADRAQLTLTRAYVAERDEAGIVAFPDSDVVIDPFEGRVGHAWASRTPAVSAVSSDAPEADVLGLADIGATRCLTIPSLVGNSVQAVWTLYD